MAFIIWKAFWISASVASGILVNSGHLLENLVFLALRRQGGEIRYYRTRSGREVDFVLVLPRGGRVLVQACQSIVDPTTRAREVAALTEAMRELGLSTAVLVTREAAEPIETEAGTIDVQPLWRFLLQPPGGSEPAA